MFIKIFCGDSDKYLLLQSTNITLNKRKTRIWHELFPLACSYIEQISLPVGDCDMKNIEYLENEFKERAKSLKQESDKFFFNYSNLQAFLADLCPNTPEQLIVPVLSNEEQRMKIFADLKEKPKIVKSEDSDQSPDLTFIAEIAVVEVDEKTYITSGPVFVMNDDGKTIDRV